jgi:hypothetical protein
MLIWNKNASSKDDAETHEFIVSQPTEEMAKMRALMDAAIKFPPDNGWAYDVDNVKVEEISQDELGNMIEEHRDRNLKEGEKRIDKALADLEKIGVRLKKPNTE